MSKLERLKTFIKVIESKTFSAASRDLGISIPAVSKQISQLEKELHIQLLERSTRSLVLTDVGRHYYESVKRLMNDFHEAEAFIAQLNKEPQGELKIVCNRYVGMSLIIPRLKEWSRLYPKVMLNIELADRIVDIMKERIDIVIGLPYGETEEVIEQKIYQTRYVFCASPAYLKQKGTPANLKELRKHSFIAHRGRQGADTQPHQILPSMQLNDSYAILQCALQGLGIAKFHEYLVLPYLENGELIEILNGSERELLQINMVYPYRVYPQSKTKLFAAFLTTSP